MVIDLYGYNIWCESTMENSKTYFKDLNLRQWIYIENDFVVHMDSYYNFLPYGFPIHGAKDWFSRKILWGSDF